MERSMDVVHRHFTRVGSVLNMVLTLVLLLCAAPDVHAKSLGKGPLLSREVEVLLEVKAAITGDPYSYLDGWDSEDACEWTGVTCGQINDRRQTITMIDWSKSNLEGTLPKSFEKLTNVQALYLHENELGGRVPNFSKWVRLKGLYLNNNIFTGTLPQKVGDLKILQALNVRGNEIAGAIPTDLDKLVSLKELDLSFNSELTGTLPRGLGRLMDLQWLRLNKCQISGTLPSSIVMLSKLKVLRLNQNQLTGTIPFFLTALTSLQELDLGDNRLSGALPIDVSSLSSLRTLDLRGNKLTGTIPSGVGRLNNLDWLKLSDNLLTGPIPTELGLLSVVQAVFLDGNDLSGSLPTELTSMARLKDLNVEANRQLCGDEVRLRLCSVRTGGTQIGNGRPCITSGVADEL